MQSDFIPWDQRVSEFTDYLEALSTLTEEKLRELPHITQDGYPYNLGESLVCHAVQGLPGGSVGLTGYQFAKAFMSGAIDDREEWLETSAFILLAEASRWLCEKSPGAVVSLEYLEDEDSPTGDRYATITMRNGDDEFVCSGRVGGEWEYDASYMSASSDASAESSDVFAFLGDDPDSFARMQHFLSGMDALLHYQDFSHPVPHKSPVVVKSADASPLSFLAPKMRKKINAYDSHRAPRETAPRQGRKGVKKKAG